MTQASLTRVSGANPLIEGDPPIDPKTHFDGFYERLRAIPGQVLTAFRAVHPGNSGSSQPVR